MQILFICKKNEVYGGLSYCRRSSGLWNSTRYIVEALGKRGVHAKIVEVVDNNDIDREVAKNRPRIVVIEALWVVPDKFDELKRLHPRVQWFIHLHSNIPFLALEGIAMSWVYRCAKKGVGIIANSPESHAALKPLVGELTYLPNIYIPVLRPPRKRMDDSVLHVACLGAIRPMKNHLLQALAAIQFAKEQGKSLKFHVNSSRIELHGEPILKNMRELFAIHSRTATLIEHPWLDPDRLPYLLVQLDMGMQVSLTETFNVVTADYVSAGLPVVVSKEVKWASSWGQAADDDIDDIVATMRRAWSWRWLIRWNQWLLSRRCAVATDAWYAFCWSHK